MVRNILSAHNVKSASSFILECVIIAPIAIIKERILSRIVQEKGGWLCRLFL